VRNSRRIKKTNLNIPNSSASSSTAESLFSSISFARMKKTSKRLILFYKFVKNIVLRLLTSRVR